MYIYFMELGELSLFLGASERVFSKFPPIFLPFGYFGNIFREFLSKRKTLETLCFQGFSVWSHLWDSNPRPADYKSHFELILF